MSNEDMVKEAVEEAKAKAAKETQENGASGGKRRIRRCEGA